MSSLLGKIAKFARSPQGQRAINQATRKAQELSKDPNTRAKVEELRSKVTKRR